MNGNAAIISTYRRYPDADAAVNILTSAGFPIRNLGIIGDEYHMELNVADWRTAADRIKLWSLRGAVAGALCALFAAAMFAATSFSGNADLFDYLAAIVVIVIEGAVFAGGLGLLLAVSSNFRARRTAGVPCERITRIDSFLLVARGTPEQAVRARTIIASRPLLGAPIRNRCA